MGWLAKIPFGRGGAAVAEIEPEETGSQAKVISGPQLMVLVNDASGRASFKTHVFDDVESATEWVRYWFPMEIEDGLTAFWAMTEAPAADSADAEPLVMIRDMSRDGVVYLFSFVDIESAQAFQRDEVERGTQPDTMFFYWAVQVKREFDRWGKLVLTPSTPTGSAMSQTPSEAFESDGWVIKEAPEVEEERKPTKEERAVMEEAPNARTGVADPNGPGQETFELTSWMDRASRSPRVQRDVIEIAAEVVAASEESFEDEFVVDEPELVAEVAAEPEPVIEDVVAVEAPVEPEPVIEDEVVVEAATEEEATAVVDVDATQAVSEGEVTEMEDGELRARAHTNGNGHKSPSAHEIVVEINGHKSAHQMAAEGTSGESLLANENGHAGQVTSPHGEGMPAIERPLNDSGAEAGDDDVPMPEIVHDVRIETATNGMADEGISIQIGIHLKSKALNVKRWEVKDEPFEGFKSPPGRF